MKFTSTRIDTDEYSSWKEYAGENNSSGRVLHYLSVIASSSLADSVQLHSSGAITRGTEKVATKCYEKGYPYFNFVDEGLNHRQHFMLMYKREYFLADFNALQENKDDVPTIFVKSRSMPEFGAVTKFPKAFSDFNSEHDSIQEACTHIYELTNATEIFIVYEEA